MGEKCAKKLPLGTKKNLDLVPNLSRVPGLNLFKKENPSCSKWKLDCVDTRYFFFLVPDRLASPFLRKDLVKWFYIYIIKIIVRKCFMKCSFTLAFVT